MQTHLPVMLEESLTGLSLRADGIYLDGTFGRVDANPFVAGTQSIPAPDVQVVSTFFRQ